MTREETIKVLAILKAAYPNSYKNMTKDEANGTVMIWSMQFANTPVELVMVAINKLISKSPFPPAICEVKDKIRGMYWEIWGQLNENKRFKTLTDEQVSVLSKMLSAIEHLRNDILYNSEPSVLELSGGTNNKLLLKE